MSRHGEAPEIQGSGVQGSGRIFVALAKTVLDLIDDELTVSDYHKFAGKKVDMGKRLWRLTSGAVNKASNVQGQRALGSDCPYSCCIKHHTSTLDAILCGLG